MMARLVLNSWPQVIHLLCPPKVLELQAWATAPSLSLVFSMEFYSFSHVEPLWKTVRWWCGMAVSPPNLNLNYVTQNLHMFWEDPGEGNWIMGAGLSHAILVIVNKSHKIWWVYQGFPLLLLPHFSLAADMRNVFCLPSWLWGLPSHVEL